jgi:hypothetical protein
MIFFWGGDLRDILFGSGRTASFENCHGNYTSVVCYVKAHITQFQCILN